MPQSVESEGLSSNNTLELWHIFIKLGHLSFTRRNTRYVYCATAYIIFILYSSANSNVSRS